MTTTLVALVTVSTAALLVGEARGWFWLRAIAKTAASGGCVLLAWATGAEGALGTTLLVALGLSFVGDVALLGKSKPAFLVGLGAFLVAHLAYVATFLQLPGSVAAGGVALALLVPFVFAVWRWLGPHVGSLRRPVQAYVTAICAMTAAAAWASGAPGGALLPAAAVTFVFSDLCVARERFVHHGLENKLLGLPTYFGAQVAFALLVPAARLDP
jgi:uncharacterized membrane protein YhhN